MDIKNFLTIGSGVALLSLVAACSEEPKNPAGPTPTPGLSSESLVPGVSSSSKGPALISSSSMKDSDAPQMACSEIMYNAPDGSTLEWVEIYIAGGMNMDKMTNFGLHLSGDVDFTFPAEPLEKGEYVVVTNDLAKFKAEYPGFAGRVFGPMEGKMVNEGGVVNVKVVGEGDVTCAFSSEPPWPSLADGKGHSLVYTGGIAAQSVSWCASALPKGNPGVGNDACIDVVNTVRINEVKPSSMTDAGFDNGWIELYNSGSAPVDVSGWILNVKVRKDSLKIKDGAVVPAGGYLVLDGASDFSGGVIVPEKQGGEIYLYGTLPGQESSIWVPAGTGVSGVVDVADGSIAQGPLATETPGAKNSAFKLGSVYINEIHYHPSNDGAVSFEFMELVNATAAPVTLYSSAVGKGWKVEGVNIEFNATDVIPANGMMLLVSDTLVADTGFIRTKHKIAADVPIRVYRGKLSNRGETLAVKEPYSKTGSGTDVKYFYVWHDATLYSDAWAGLTEADGLGHSLQRKDVSSMGYGPSVWKAATPTPGTK